MDPDQDIYCSKEPSVVHGSQPPGRRRGTGGRTAVQERFTGVTSRGVDKPAAPPPNRSSATPSTGPGESLLRAEVAGGQRLRPGEGWGRACVKGLDPAVIGSLAAASPWETTIAEAADASRSMARPPHGPRIMAHWRVQGWDMSRTKAGDETNRALVAYVRKLSDEELADLLVSLDPKVYQDLLERALGQQPRKRPPRVKP
jgi:hypothetical protein